MIWEASWDTVIRSSMVLMPQRLMMRSMGAKCTTDQRVERHIGAVQRTFGRMAAFIRRHIMRGLNPQIVPSPQ